jgi:hypothetical protein
MLLSYKRLLRSSSLLFTRSLLVLTPDFIFPLLIACVQGESSKSLGCLRHSMAAPRSAQRAERIGTSRTQFTRSSRAECP